MNEELELSRVQLEAMTSRRNVNRTLDAETAALRDNFRAFGHATEQAAADFDEAALIERLQDSLGFPSHDISVRPRSTVSIWPLLLSGALAASALISAIRIAATWPDSPQLVSPPVVVASDSRGANETRALAPPAGENNSPALFTLSDQAHVSWHDDLDDEISAAQSALAGVASNAASLDSSLSSIGDQLDAMASDLTEGSL